MAVTPALVQAQRDRLRLVYAAWTEARAERQRIRQKIASLRDEIRAIRLYLSANDPPGLSSGMRELLGNIRRGIHGGSHVHGQVFKAAANRGYIALRVLWPGDLGYPSWKYNGKAHPGGWELTDLGAHLMRNQP